MDEKNLVEVGFEIDVESLKTNLSEAEQLMQQGVRRLNGIGANESSGAVVSSPAGGSPPLPPTQPQPAPAVPAPAPTAPAPAAPTSPIGSAWDELKKIQGMAGQSPDVALAALEGVGGLRSRVKRAAISDPDSATAYQELMASIKELTTSIKDGVRESKQGESGGAGGPAGGILGFLKGNASLNALGTVASNASQGNLLGAGGSAIGGLLGFAFGGPLGAQAGASLGAMAGGTLGSFLGGASEAQQYTMETADISARFGDFGENADLEVRRMNDMDTSGYNIQETAGLFDALRQSHVIEGVDDESRELVESIQELTRATGLNTDAIVKDYASYENTGGEGTASEYMAQVISGAVATGMRANLQDYSELLGSARMQLVYRSGQGDMGDGALKAIQGTLVNLMGNQSRTADLLRDNPMMAQQMLSSFLQTGGAQQYSFDAAAMQMAGVERGKTDAAYATPEQQVQNALTRQQSVIQNFLGSALPTMGYGSVQDLQAAVQQNPDLLQNLITSSNPNSQQAAALQDQLNIQFQGQFGRAPTAQDVQMFTQLGTAYLTQGSLTPQSVTADGDSIADLITDSQKTEGQAAREAQQQQHDEMMKFMGNFDQYLTKLQELGVSAVQHLNTIADAMAPIANYFAPQTQPQAIAITGDATVDAATAETAKQQAQNSVALLEPLGVNPSAMAEELARRHREQVPGVSASQPNAGNALLNPGGVDPSAMAQELARRRNAGGQAANSGLSSLGQFVGGNGKPSQRNTAAHDDDGVFSPVAYHPDETVLTDKPVHAAFNDTPPGGVMATTTHNTFQFAPGDVVHASQGGGGKSSAEPAVQINVTVQAPHGADFDMVRSAAQAGTEAGGDAFIERWKNRDRGGAKIENAMY